MSYIRDLTVYGVPQSSVLGPLLFLIYMNDTVNCVEGANVRLFADDTAIFIHGKDLHKIYTDMQSPVCKAKDWFVSNRLTLNLSKMSYSIFHTWKKKITGIYNNLKIGGEHIFCVNVVKYLGMCRDDILTWKGHIDHVIKSVSKYLGIFNKIRGLIPNQYKHTVYYACIYSRMSYDTEVYGACGVTLQKRLQIVMNELIKFIFIKIPYHSTNEMFMELSMVKIKDIYEANVLNFVNKLINGPRTPIFRTYFKCAMNFTIVI